MERNPALFDVPIEPRLVRMRSIRYIVSHMAAAEERWIERRIHGREITDYEERAPDSVAGVFEDWEQIRGRTLEYVRGLNPDDFQRVYTIALRNEVTLSLTVEQILFHIFNHETHHRAQISMALQQCGVDPPEFDFVFLK